jgi:hypothetical protein
MPDFKKSELKLIERHHKQHFTSKGDFNRCEHGVTPWLLIIYKSPIIGIILCITTIL